MVQKVFRESNQQQLIALVEQKAGGSIFLVRAQKSYCASGANKLIESLANGAQIVSFTDFNPNPQLEDIIQGIELFKKYRCGLIIAVGGGSALDVAKTISLLAHQTASATDIVTGTAIIENIKTPVLAIPTTAGSGAEATQFTVLYIDKKKYSLAHPALLPECVYLSAKLTHTASAYLTASTGADAFCQAVESLWSVGANNESEQYALEAIELIWSKLYASVHQCDSVARQNMLEAAFLAGQAINITKTTACHALSYSFTSFFNIPHGHAVALSLPFFTKFNYEVNAVNCNDSRGSVAVQNRIDKLLAIIKTDIDNAPNKISEFFESIGLKTKIYELIPNFDPKIVVENADLDRLSNNPRKVTKEDIWEFLKEDMYLKND